MDSIHIVISVDMYKFHLLRPTKTMYRLALQRRFIKNLKRHVKERKEMDVEKKDGGGDGDIEMVVRVLDRQMTN